MTTTFLGAGIETARENNQEWVEPAEAEALAGVGAEIEDEPFAEVDWQVWDGASAYETAPTRRALLAHRFRELWLSLRAALSTGAAASRSPERFTDEQWRALADTALFARRLGFEPSEMTGCPGENLVSEREASNSPIPAPAEAAGDAEAR